MIFSKVSLLNTNGKGSANAQGESGDFVEKRLIQKAQKGCMSSFEQLIFLYEDRIFHFIFKKTNDYHQSQDILQATFLRVYKNLGKFKEKYKFSTWVYTIANRQVIDYLRTVKLTNSAPLEEECFGASDQEIINGDFTDDLWHKIQAKLSDSQYQALWLFYGEELTLKQIAQTMNKNISSIKVLLHRSRQKLCKELSRNPIT